MAEIKHPVSGIPIEGREIALEEVLEATDRYGEKMNGKWEPCSRALVGKKLGNHIYVWVRPPTPVV